MIVNNYQFNVELIIHCEKMINFIVIDNWLQMNYKFYRTSYLNANKLKISSELTIDCKSITNITGIDNLLQINYKLHRNW